MKRTLRMRSETSLPQPTQPEKGWKTKAKKKSDLFDMNANFEINRQFGIGANLFTCVNAGAIPTLHTPKTNNSKNRHNDALWCVHRVEGKTPTYQYRM
jgi:hypothetical protein